MPVSVLLFIVVVAIFSYRGFRQGGLRATAGVLALLAGYCASFIWAPVAAEWLEANSTLQGLMALAAAGAVIFLLALFAVRFAASLLAFTLRRLNKQDEEIAPVYSPLSRLLATSVGASVGLVVALLLVYAYGIAAPILIPKVFPSATILEDEPSIVTRWANDSVGALTAKVLASTDVESDVAKVSAAAMAQPLQTAQSLQGLSDSAELQQLFKDPQQLQVLVDGDLDRVIDLPAFQQLASNEDMQHLAEIAGMRSDAAPDEYPQQLAAKISQAAQRMEQVRSDPRLQEILSNPEFQRQINSGNPLLVLNSPELAEIAGILFNEQ